MPRTSRTSVEFPVKGLDNIERMWVANFGHQHTSPLKPIFVPGKGSAIVPVQHITTCSLGIKSDTNTVEAISACALGDTYRWQFGIKKSLERALEMVGIKFGDVLYGRAMGSFYAELKVKAYGPGIVPPIPNNADIHADSPFYVPRIPAENLNGLGYGERS